MTRRGGATDTLPLPETFAELDSKWDLFYVSAHGNLTGRMMVVPENTYILNLATSGKPCMKVAWNIENWIYDYDPSTRIPTKSIKQKMYESIKGKTFLRNSGPTANTERMYTPGTSALNTAEQYTGSADPAQTTLAFYEPGDLMFDNSLTLYNTNYPLFLMGAYTIPVAHKFRKTLFNMNKHIYPEGTNINSLSTDDIQESIRQGLTTAAPTEDQHQLFNTVENLIQPKMFPTGQPIVTNLLLSEVIDYVNTKSTAGEKRLFIVKACRVASDKPTAMLMRRFSIAARERVREGVTNKARLLRSRLNITFLTNIKTALMNLSDKATLSFEETTRINLALERINNILSYEDFSMSDVYSILKVANRHIAFQPEFKKLMNLP